MEIKIEKTERGFAVGEFTDQYRKKCSIQKSSLMTGDCIWLGVDDPEPVILARDTPQGGNGWVPYHIPAEVSLHTRMHLTQEMAAALIPLLRHFVDTGELPSEQSSPTPTDTQAEAQAWIDKMPADCIAIAVRREDGKCFYVLRGELVFDPPFVGPIHNFYAPTDPRALEAVGKWLAGQKGVSS